MKFNHKEFFSNKHNVFLVLILLGAFLIRLQFFDINTGFWWDESEYLNMGKHFANGLEMNLNAQRPLLFPLFISIFYKLGLGVDTIRFFTVLVPSLLVVLFMYLLGKEMYNRKTGLIAASMMAVSWLLLFNTARVHTDALGLMFNIGTLYFFWKGWVKEKNTKFLILAGIFAAAGFLTRVAAILVPLIIIAYLIVTERQKLLKHTKLLLTTLIISFALVVPYLLWAKKTFGTYLAFSSGYTNAGEGLPYGWYILDFVKQGYLGTIFYWFMWIGLLITVFYLIIGFDIFLKGKNIKLKADFMILLFVVAQLGYFIFIQRAAEDRWLMPAYTGLFLLSSRGIMAIYKPIKKTNLKLGVLFIIIVVILGGWAHYQDAEQIIDARKDSEANVQVAGGWLKERTSAGDVIMSSNVHMELLHATERKIQSFGSDEEETIELVQETKPEYLMLSNYYRSEDWHYQFPQKYPEKFELVHVLTEKFETSPGVMEEVPMVMIFKVKSYEF